MVVPNSGTTYPIHHHLKTLVLNVKLGIGLWVTVNLTLTPNVTLNCSSRVRVMFSVRVTLSQNPNPIPMELGMWDQCSEVAVEQNLWPPFWRLPLSLLYLWARLLGACYIEILYQLGLVGFSRVSRVSRMNRLRIRGSVRVRSGFRVRVQLLFDWKCTHWLDSVHGDLCTETSRYVRCSLVGQTIL